LFLFIYLLLFFSGSPISLTHQFFYVKVRPIPQISSTIWIKTCAFVYIPKFEIFIERFWVNGARIWSLIWFWIWDLHPNFQFASFVIDHDDSWFGFYDGKQGQLLAAPARGREVDMNRSEANLKEGNLYYVIPIGKFFFVGFSIIVHVLMFVWGKLCICCPMLIIFMGFVMKILLMFLGMMKITSTTLSPIAFFLSFFFFLIISVFV